MAASAGVLTLAGAAVLGPADTRAYVLEVLPQARHFLGRLGNFSLLSIGVGLSGPWLGWTLEVAGILWVLSVLARRPGGADRTWVTATSGALVISPLSWVGYPILVLPGLLVLARALDLGTRRDRLTLLLLTFIVGFWIDSLRLGPGPLPLLFASVPTVGFGVLMEVASRRLS